MPPPDSVHGVRQARLAQQFLNYSDQYGGQITGEAGFILQHVEPETVLAPDVIYTRPERLPKVNERGFGKYAPNVAAEFGSPSHRPRERRRKLRA